jgi:hypothetical protein
MIRPVAEHLLVQFQSRQRRINIQTVEHIALLVIMRREDNVVDDVLKCLKNETQRLLDKMIERNYSPPCP